MVVVVFVVFGFRLRKSARSAGESAVLTYKKHVMKIKNNNNGRSHGNILQTNTESSLLVLC